MWEWEVNVTKNQKNWRLRTNFLGKQESKDWFGDVQRVHFGTENFGEVDNMKCCFKDTGVQLYEKLAAKTVDSLMG